MSKSKVIWYVIADGARARILHRDGEKRAFHTVKLVQSDAARHRTSELGHQSPEPTIETVSVAKHTIPPRHEPHQEAKTAFAVKIAQLLNDASARGEVDQIVLAAPAHALGDIKMHLRDDVKARIIGELSKDLTRTPDGELGTHLDEIADRVRLQLL